MHLVHIYFQSFCPDLKKTVYEFMNQYADQVVHDYLEGNV